MITVLSSPWLWLKEFNPSRCCHAMPCYQLTNYPILVIRVCFLSLDSFFFFNGALQKVTYVPTRVPEHKAAVEPPGLAAPVDEAAHRHGAAAGLQVVHRGLMFCRRKEKQQAGKTLWMRTGVRSAGTVIDSVCSPLKLSVTFSLLVVNIVQCFYSNYYSDSKHDGPQRSLELELVAHGLLWQSDSKIR